MKIDVLTIFPDFFKEVFDFGIIRRARLAGIVEIGIHDLREFTTDKHRMVDDRPFGGGDGMVLKCEPIFAAIENLVETDVRINSETLPKIMPSIVSTAHSANCQSKNSSASSSTASASETQTS